MKINIHVRLEPELKQAAKSVLDDGGLSISGAIRLFLQEVVAQQGLPCELKKPNATTIAAMNEAEALRKARFKRAKER